MMSAFPAARRIALVALVAIPAGVAGWMLRGPSFDVGLYAQARFAAVQQHLDEARPGYMLLAGDSNAELVNPAERLCGSPLVVAGIGGATSQIYLPAFETLRFPVKPRAALLLIGTNDVARKNGPREPQAAARFEETVAALVARLNGLTETVLVAALPPVDRESGGHFDAAAAADYSARIAMLCGRLGCRFVDPFARARDGASGYSLPGANRVGVHLVRYEPMLQAVAAALCPGQAADTDVTHAEARPAP